MKKTLSVLMAICLFFSVVLLAFAQEMEEKKASTGQDQLKLQEAEVKEEIKVIMVEPYCYAAVEMTGGYDQHEEAFNILYGEAGKLELDMNQPSFGIYYSDPETTPEAELKWEIGLPVPMDQKLEEPLKLKKWEFKMLASEHYNGNFSGEVMQEAYSALFQWISDNKYMPAGPVMEKYFGMPQQNEKGEWCGEIEILVPVQKIVEKSKVEK